MEGRDVFQFRDVRRLAAWFGYCLVQGPRGRYLLLNDCESDQVIYEFTDLESVQSWLEGTRFSPC